MSFLFSSTDAVYAPGFVMAMRAMPALTGDQGQKAAAVYMLSVAFPNAPGWALNALAEGRYTVDKEAETVLVEQPER